MLKRHMLRMFGVCFVLTMFGVWAEGTSETKRPDVQYVPTPHEVVAEMLRLAAVTKNDVVYDLGSGDGRLVIAAAKQYGARGVGIDIDPQRIRESRANARQAGVSKRVRFLQQDLFETDIRQASVVTLYLLPRLNVQLRPILLRDLKPGTRVVSHDFDMAEWKPDQTKQVAGPSRQHPIYYWMIPATVEGTWRLQVPGLGGQQPFQLRLQQQFQEVRGSLRSDAQEVPLTRATLVGDHLRFTLTTDKQEQMSFDGRVDGQAMHGRVEVQTGTNKSQYDWTSQREQASPDTGSR